MMQAAVDFIARCLSASNARQIAEIEQQTGGVSIVQISQEDFDQLDPKDPNTIYYVYRDGVITQYMGDTKLSSGQAIVDGVFKRNTYQSILSNITLEGE